MSKQNNTQSRTAAQETDAARSNVPTRTEQQNTRQNRR